MLHDVLCVCRNPYGENTTGLPERTNSDAGAYAEACKSVAMENNLPVLDIWSKMQEFPHWEKTFLRYSNNNLLFLFICPFVCLFVCNLN